MRGRRKVVMIKKIRYITARGITGQMFLFLEKYVNKQKREDILIETWDKNIYWTFQIQYKKIKSCINISKYINVDTYIMKKIKIFVEEFSKKINDSDT